MSASTELNLAQGGGLLSFDSRRALDAWVVDEAKAWSDILPRLRGTNIRYAALAAMAIQERLNAIVAAVGDKAGDLAEVGQRVRDASFQNGEQFISAKSAAGLLVAQLAARDIHVAGAALAYLSRTNFARRSYNPNEENWTWPFQEGVSAAQLLEAGLGNTSISAEKQALELLHSTWVGNLSTLQNEYLDQIRQNMTDLNQRIEIEAQHDDEFGESLRSQKQILTETQTAAEDDHRRVRELFMKHMALEAPVKYWRSRAKWGHALGGVMLGVTLVAGALLALYFQRLMTKLLAAVTTTANHVGDSAPPLDWPHYSIAGATLLLGAWGIRILLRVAFGFWDSATDAGERATIIQTYLALLKDPGGLPAEAISVLLQAIVRPSGTRGDNPGLFDAEALKQASEFVKGKG